MKSWQKRSRIGEKKFNHHIEQLVALPYNLLEETIVPYLLLCVACD